MQTTDRASRHISRSKQALSLLISQTVFASLSSSPQPRTVMAGHGTEVPSTGTSGQGEYLSLLPEPSSPLVSVWYFFLVLFFWFSSFWFSSFWFFSLWFSSFWFSSFWFSSFWFSSFWYF